MTIKRPSDDGADEKAAEMLDDRDGSEDTSWL